MSYTPPTAEQVLALKANARIEELAQAERFASASADMVEAIVEGIGQFAVGEFAPLNRAGDTEGARLVGGEVRLPDGYKEAYHSLVEQGWNGIAASPKFGGQGLPFSLAVCALESLGSANLGFSLLPLLTVGAIDAIEAHGSDAQKATYLEKLISGEWSGTMNLTEPQAGSDVGALRTSAEPIAEGPHAGKYRISGTKIFISWGEHELAENIVHLVLARIPGAPDGSRGISLFIVPRRQVEANGSLGGSNDVKAISLEHKMGIHASPTCVMSYGEDGECIGELIGGENQGLRCMFTMMNNARINVGAQGVMIGEGALQLAGAYARERVQSPRAGSPDKSPVAIIEHADVRRMLLRMRALTEGARALLYYCCGQIDCATLGDEEASARADLLVPMVKAWCTDAGCEVASLGVQVHGGMGFIEETGAAQFYRDARITPIYEGTNGIQAADLVTRKLGMDGGAGLRALMQEIERDAAGEPVLAALARDCVGIAEWMMADASIDDRLAGSVAFLEMCAVAVAGWQLLRQVALAEHEGGAAAATKPVVARYFIDVLVTEAMGLKANVTNGAEILYQLDGETLTS